MPERDDKAHAMTMLRKGRYKLIRYPSGEGAVYEMYDLEDDPEEIRDIYPAMSSQPFAVSLQEELDAWSLREIALY